MVPPLEAGASGSKSSPGLSSPVIVPLATSANDIQSEAAERATFLRAKLAQLHQAYVLEKDGVLPPLAVPRPASLQVDPRGPACDMSEFSTLFGPSERSNVMRTPAPAIASSVSESEWSVLSRSSDQPSDIEVDEESRVSLDAVSQSEGSALSFSSRLAHENADAARYFDAYRAARLDSLEHQLARRALSRTLARREAEASTMKAVLRMHTLERSLRDSGAVLQSAKDVERLLDDISVKEATLTMLNGVDKKHPNATTSSSAVAYESVFAAPATAPWLLPGVTQTPDVLAEYVSDHARRAEPYLLASRLYHAARYHLCAERLQQPSPSDVVTLIFTEPGKIVLPEHQHLIDWKHIAPIIKSIAMEANAGWLAPPWQAAMLERLIRMACGTIAMDADALRQAAKASCRSLPFEVTPEDLLMLIQSDAVQRQVDAVVREAQKIVRDNKRSSDTMSSTLKSPNAVDSLLFVYVPWYLEKHDVLTVLLKPGFITDTLAEDKQRPDQTKPDSVRGWTRLKSPRAEEDAMKIDTETEDAASTVAPKPHTSKASMTAEDHSAHPNPLLLISNLAQEATAVPPSPSKDTTSRHAASDPWHEDWRRQAELMLTADDRKHMPSAHHTPTPADPETVPPSAAGSASPPADSGLSKSQRKKAFKRQRIEEAKRKRAERSSIDGMQPAAGSSSAASGTTLDDWDRQARRASSSELHEAREAYTNMRVQASALLQALLERHKVLSHGLLAELKLQDRGFYRLSRAEMEVLSHYPEVIIVNGESYITSTPLPERDVGGSGDRDTSEGKGKATDIVTDDLDEFRRQWNAELGHESDASDDTEIAIEYADDDDEDQVMGEGEDEAEEIASD